MKHAAYLVPLIGSPLVNALSRRRNATLSLNHSDVAAGIGVCASSCAVSLLRKKTVKTKRRFSTLGTHVQRSRNCIKRFMRVDREGRGSVDICTSTQFTKNQNHRYVLFGHQNFDAKHLEFAVLDAVGLAARAATATAVARLCRRVLRIGVNDSDRAHRPVVVLRPPFLRTIFRGPSKALLRWRRRAIAEWR